MERKLAGGGIGGGGREERCRGYKTSAKGQHRNRCIGSEGMKRLGAGGRVSGGWLRQAGSNALGRKKGCVQYVWTIVVHEPSGLEPFEPGDATSRAGSSPLATCLLAARTGVHEPTRVSWRLKPAQTGVHEPTRL